MTNELHKYVNCRVFLKPPVLFFLEERNYEWLVTSILDKVMSLQSSPDDFLLRISRTFIVGIDEYLPKPDWIKRGTLLVKGRITYDGEKFACKEFPNEVF